MPDDMKAAKSKSGPPAESPAGPGIRALMRAALAKRPVRQVVLPAAVPVRAGEVLVLPRSPGVPELADLSGRPKLLIACGPQNSGKTLDMRMLASEASEAGRLDRIVFAAADPGARSLSLFVENVEQPASVSQEAGAAFIGDVHRFMREGGDDRPDLFCLDCGGNNTSLPLALEENPRFVAELEAAGVAVVLSYYWTPRTDDLGLLEQHAERGLVSPYTMLSLNLGKASRGLESFEVLRGQEVWRRMVAAGAAELVLPRLSEEWAQAVEDARFPFWMARDGVVPEGLDAEPLETRGQVALGDWMARWRTARAPVGTWLR